MPRDSASADGIEHVVIIGATSAIAGEVARRFAAAHAALLLIGRDARKLDVAAADLTVRGASRVETLAVDFTNATAPQEILRHAAAFERIDDVLVAHGMLPVQTRAARDVSYAREAVEVNYVSAIAILTVLASHLERQRSGCLAVIGSVAGDRGRPSNYVYGSAKAGLASFMSGLEARLTKAGVRVVTIKPGMVDTPMTSHLSKGPLFTSVSRVGERIHHAMSHRSGVVYVPWYWRWIMLGIRVVPSPIFNRMNL
jgi:short-subunit dehydrogenase